MADGICVGLQIAAAVLSAWALQAGSERQHHRLSAGTLRSARVVSPVVPLLGAVLLTTAAIAAPGGVGGHGHGDSPTEHAHGASDESHVASEHDHGETASALVGAVGDDGHAHDHVEGDSMGSVGDDDHSTDASHDHAAGASDVGGDGTHDHTTGTDGSATAHDHSTTAGVDHAQHESTVGGDHAHDTTAPGGTDHAHDTTAPGGTDHPHDTTAPGGTDHPHDTTAPDGGHQHPVCTAPITAGQQIAADLLVQMSRSVMTGYEDIERAKADGFVPITPVLGGLQHYGHFDRMADGTYIDPWKMESLIYATSGNGIWYLVGGMFWQDDMNVTPPQPGGCATTWHNHTNLCIAPGKGMVGVVNARGECPPGSVNEPTAGMLHVWYIDLPTGPYSDLGEANPAAIKAGIKAKYF